MGLFDFLRRKARQERSNANGGGREADHVPRVCFVLCRAATTHENPHFDDTSNLSNVVAGVFGHGYSVEVAKEDIVAILRGEDTVGFLAHMPAPIPNHEAEENADNNFLWPNGKDEAAQHRSHVIVTFTELGDSTPIQSAIALTRLALVALRFFDGIGVYWGDASVSNSRDFFEGCCESLSEEYLPVPLWLRFQLVRATSDEVGLYTLGMRQFGLMEIEVDRTGMSVQELFAFVSNLAHYLMQNGPVIADGNTFGGSVDERILVRHRASMIDQGRRVYKIVFEE